MYRETQSNRGIMYRETQSNREPRNRELMNRQTQRNREIMNRELMYRQTQRNIKIINIEIMNRGIMNRDNEQTGTSGDKLRHKHMEVSLRTSAGLDVQHKHRLEGEREREG